MGFRSLIVMDFMAFRQLGTLVAMVIILTAVIMKSLAIALIALIASSLTSSAVVDLGMPSSATPYDRYMAPVKTTLSSLGKNRPNMETVNALMKQGRSFRYRMDNPYVASLPSETARTRTGDCKDKALWLCDQLNDSSVRFVIGKTHPSAKMSHAWVLWNDGSRYWILDCTLKRAPIAADTLPADRYTPQFSYSKATAYRHGINATNIASVANSKTAPVASVASSSSRR
jgi:hypothetical protein